MKILSMTLGKSVTLLQHCKEKAAAANQKINLLTMVKGKSWGASKKTLLTIYKQLIRPVLEYGAVAFTAKDATALNHLEMAEKRARRVVLGVGPRTPIKSLYEMTRLYSIAERIECLKSKALLRFDHKSKGLLNLAILKEIIGV